MLLRFKTHKQIDGWTGPQSETRRQRVRGGRGGAHLGEGRGGGGASREAGPGRGGAAGLRRLCAAERGRGRSSGGR